MCGVLGCHTQCKLNSNIKGMLLQLQSQKLGNVSVKAPELLAFGYFLSPWTYIIIPSLNTIETVFHTALPVPFPSPYFCIAQCYDDLEPTSLPWATFRVGTAYSPFYKGKVGSIRKKQPNCATPCFSAYLCYLLLCVHPY